MVNGQARTGRDSDETLNLAGKDDAPHRDRNPERGVADGEEAPARVLFKWTRVSSLDGLSVPNGHLPP